MPQLDSTGALIPITTSGALYSLHVENHIEVNDNTDPFTYGKTGLIFPPYIAKRIVGQYGLFSYQPNPFIELQDQLDESLDKVTWIRKYEFSAQTASDIQRNLFYLGIRHESIFPELDGISFDLRIKFNISCVHGEDV